jgi:hypothetical protein
LQNFILIKSSHTMEYLKRSYRTKTLDWHLDWPKKFVKKPISIRTSVLSTIHKQMNNPNEKTKPLKHIWGSSATNNRQIGQDGYLWPNTQTTHDLHIPQRSPHTKF